MPSKNDPSVREKQKSLTKKPVGECGHEVKRVMVGQVKGPVKLQWYCETCETRR
jgi:hypothetical protein